MRTKTLELVHVAGAARALTAVAAVSAALVSGAAGILNLDPRALLADFRELIMETNTID